MLWLLCLVFDGGDGKALFEEIAKGIAGGVFEFRGVNQSVAMRGVRDALNVTVREKVVISNFTFVGGKSVTIRVVSGNLVFQSVTFLRGVDFMVECVDASVRFEECVFANLAVKGRHLLQMTGTSALFLNTTFDSLSHLPGSQVAVAEAVSCNLTWQGCRITGLYQNPIFTNLTNSTLVARDSEFSKNTGKLLVSAANGSQVDVENCTFLSNSCPLLLLNSSRGSITHVSLHANCIKDPLITLTHEAVLNINGAQFFEVSCGILLSANASAVAITQATLNQAIFPGAGMLLHQSQIDIANSSFLNVTAVNGSVILANASTLSVSSTTFSSINSRSSGAVLAANASTLVADNITIANSFAKSDGAMLFLSNCTKDFAIRDSSFANNTAERTSSILVSHCLGEIQSSQFTGALQRELSVPLFTHCRNCTFAPEAEPPRAEILYSPRYLPPYPTLIGAALVASVVAAALRARIFLRLFRIRSYFNRHV